MGTSESKCISKSYVLFQNEPTGSKTIPDFLLQHASTYPNRDAIVYMSADGSRESITFKELYEKSCKAGRSLVKLGVKRHEFVAINMRNCPEWSFLTFGTMMSGATPISISFTYKDGSDVVAIMEKLSTCSTIVVDPGINDENMKIFSRLIDHFSATGAVKSQKMPYLRYLICHDRQNIMHNVLTVREMMSKELVDVKFPEISEQDIAVLFQTSGSTGVPKFTAHTHASLLSVTNYFRSKYYTKDDIYFCDRPFGWIGGFPFGVIVGQTRVTQSGFSPEPEDKLTFFVSAMTREHCTAVLFLTPALSELLRRKDEVKGTLKVKTIITGGQPVSKYLSSCVGIFCENFIAIYGSTECLVASATIVTNADTFVEYACGYPLPGVEIKIVDDEGDIVPINTHGEVYVRNHDSMFQEYWNDAKKTKQVKTDDEWYKTDDMGRMTADAALFVDGRTSDMILSGGMNVAPQILESVIKSCPGIDSVVVVPVADEVQYQVLCACVILKQGYDVTVEQIHTFCEDFHNDKPGMFTVLPTYYSIMKQFPETYTGKTSRKILTEIANKTYGKSTII